LGSTNKSAQDFDILPYFGLNHHQVLDKTFKGHGHNNALSMNGSEEEMHSSGAPSITGHLAGPEDASCTPKSVLKSSTQTPRITM